MRIGTCVYYKHLHRLGSRNFTIRLTLIITFWFQNERRNTSEAMEEGYKNIKEQQTA